MQAVIRYLIFSFIIFLSIFIGINNFSSAQIGDEEQEILSQGFESVNKAVEETTDTIEKTEKALSDAKMVIQKLRQSGKISKNKALELLQGITEAEHSLDMSKVPLKNYSKYSGKVGKVTELYSELSNIQNTYQSNNTYLGQTGGGLAVLSNLAEKFGDNIPVPGFREAVKAYGQVTGKLLESTVQVSKNIQTYQNQNVIGGASYKAGADRQKQEIFARDFPKHSGYHYIPTSPYYLYEAIEGPHARFIWDEDEQKFYPVAPNVPVNLIHRYNLLLDRDMNPKKLKAFADKWEEIGDPRNQSANKLADLFNAYQIQNLPSIQKMAILDIRSKYFDQLSYTSSDRDLFIAQYIFDKAFKANVDKALTELYNNVAVDPQQKGFADYLFKFAKQNNIYIVYLQPEEERKNFNKPTRITENNNNNTYKPERRPTPIPTPAYNNYQSRSTSTNQQGIDEASKKLKEQRAGQANCSAYMNALSSHYANYKTHDGSKYWVEFIRPYTYEDGNCIGAHHIWRKIQGKEPYVEVYFYTADKPAKIPLYGLIKEYKAKHPGAGWAE